MAKGLVPTQELLKEWVKKGLLNPADLIPRSIQKESSPSQPQSLEPSKTFLTEPKLNKLETEYLRQLRAGGWMEIEAQSLKIRVGPVGKRCHYTPDFTAINPVTGMFTLFEVKGPYEWEDARVKRMVIAVTCRRWRWAFVFARKVDGNWQEEALA